MVHWGALGVGACISYLIYSVIYNLFFHPLANYPGPFWSKISTVPSYYHALKGDRHIWIWQNFEKYGNKWRPYPNGAVFRTPEAHQAIFSLKSNVRKGKFYGAWMRGKGDLHTLNTEDSVVHAHKRRLLNQAFTEKSLRSAGEFIASHVDRWNELLVGGGDAKENGTEWSESVNIADWDNYLAFDIMAELSFGRSLGTKERGDNQFKVVPHATASYMQFFYPVTKSPFIDLWCNLRPWGLGYLMNKMAPPEIISFYKFVHESALLRKTQYDEQQESEKPLADSNERRHDLFHYLLEARDPETGEPAYTLSALDAEASLLVVAGSDTSSITLTVLFFYLSRNPRVYDKLVKEIRDTFVTAEYIVNGPTLNSCEYVRACIEEALRMAPPVCAELTRIVCPGGLQVDGDFLPEGVEVGTSAFSNGRSEDIFGDANVFRPERWIVDEAAGVISEDVSRAKSLHFPFLAGVGVCAGRAVAMSELTLTIARTFHRLDMRATPGSTLGEGAPELGWGRNDRGQFQIDDGYIAIRDGPMLQFRKRVA